MPQDEPQAEAVRGEDGEHHDLVNALMENSTDHIYFKDLNGRFLRISKTQAHLFGLRDPAEAIGKTDFDFFAAEHAQQACAYEQEIIRAGRPMVGKEEKETWPDGRVTRVSATTAKEFADDVCLAATEILRLGVDTTAR
jgi:PAS domain S-box-containing protein